MNKSGRNYRIVPGALASPALLAWGARNAILAEAERLYPQMRRDIETIAAHFRATEPENQEQFLAKRCAQFCRKWGLCDGRGPASWALTMAQETARLAARTGRWPGWQMRYAEFAPAADEALGWEPDLEPWRRARRRIARGLWRRAGAVIRAWRAAGWRAVRERREPQVVAWAARALVGGESWERLAEGSPEGSDARKLAARELLRAAGLCRAPGRPPLHR